MLGAPNLLFYNYLFPVSDVYTGFGVFALYLDTGEGVGGRVGVVGIAVDIVDACVVIAADQLEIACKRLAVNTTWYIQPAGISWDICFLCKI